MHMALNEDRFITYASSALGRVSDCYIATVKRGGEIELLVKSTLVISVE